MSAMLGAWKEIKMLRFSIFSVFKLCMFFKLAIHMIFGFCWEGGYHLGDGRCHLGKGGSFLTILWLTFALLFA